MSQCSEVTRSWIGTSPAVYFTLDGLVTGPLVRIQFESSGWNKLKNTEDQCLEAVEVQQVDVGGTTGTDGFEVLLKAPVLRNAVYAKFLAQRNTPATVYAAQFTLAERDAADAERVLAFTKLAWIGLDFDRSRRIAAGYVFDVEARLRSVE